MAFNYKYFFKNTIENTKSFFSGSQSHPKDDWVFMLNFFFIALLILVTLNVFIFFNQERIRNVDLKLDQTPADLDILTRGVDTEMDKEELDKILKFFEEKEGKLNAIREELNKESLETITKEREEGLFREETDLPDFILD